MSLYCLIWFHLPTALSCIRGFCFHVFGCFVPNPTTYHNTGNVSRPLTFRGNISYDMPWRRISPFGFWWRFYFRFIVCVCLLHHFRHYFSKWAISLSRFKLARFQRKRKKLDKVISFWNPAVSKNIKKMNKVKILWKLLRFQSDLKKEQLYTTIERNGYQREHPRA